MSASGKYRARYTYSFQLDAKGQVFTEGSEMTKKDVQEFVDEALGLMTAGCELCVHSQRMYCEKLGRPLKVLESRCEFFSRRPSANLPPL